MAVWKPSPGGYALSHESWEMELGFFLGCLERREETLENVTFLSVNPNQTCSCVLSTLSVLSRRMMIMFIKYVRRLQVTSWRCKTTKRCLLNRILAVGNH